MNNKKQKLELTWIGKDREINLEPRILVEVPEKNYGDKNTENMLIHGDNLLALKALEQDYSGKIKCIYIDPPYNTGSAFEHYDDNVEHSTWLSLMKQRLYCLRNLLRDDGSIFIQIDANEMPYLKLLLDEVFGRNNFINFIDVKTKIAGVSGSHLGKSLQDNIEYIIGYAKNLENFVLYETPKKQKELMSYINDMLENGKSWKYTSVLQDIDEGSFIKDFYAGNGDKIRLFKHRTFNTVSINQIAKEKYDGDLKKAYYNYVDQIFRTTNAQTSIRTKVIEETKNIDGEIFSIQYIPTKGKNAGKMTTFYYKSNNLITWLKDVVVKIDNKLIKLDNMGNLWDDIQYNNLTKEGDVQFPNGKKPEMLLQRIFNMVTEEGDLVLDSFLGSGTTAAVAHKMGRRWIGIELGDHCYTHCEPRLQRVVDGTDQGGISKAVNWQGGGGYKFYELAPSLLKKDEFGEWIIEPKYDAEMLAEAMAKNEGYKYSPDGNNPYKQGYSTEKDFIFTTTQFITAELLNKIQHELKEDESLLICTTHYEENCIDKFSNITVKKIPHSLLKRCEFGKLEYNLNVTEEEPRDTEDNDMEEDE